MDIDVSAVVAIVGAVIAAAALYLTWRQVQLSNEQTKLQQQLRRDAAQPYVWADIRLHEQHGWSLMLVLKNEGPTVASSVAMTFDPPLPGGWRQGRSVGPTASDHPGTARFEALPPGRVMQWNLGANMDVFAPNDPSNPAQFTVTIDAHGPFGPVDTLKYVIDVGDYNGAAATVPGTPLSIAKAIKDGTAVLNTGLKSVAKRLPDPAGE
ncbi:hypothetical protein [Williamsia sp.]|uniref:hypothetical protein n=1 Tax=Williamsia sp. TaxID=1872085 RepID=UPI001A289047|nr:hypothetical protein [Williamsia sp.]MBJ7287580.1 hypothetical protein [Williamsia sp.]